MRSGCTIAGETLQLIYEKQAIDSRMLLAQGKPQAAQDLLQEIEQSAQEHGRLSSLISIYLLAVLVDQALNQPAAALDRLGQAISLAAPEGYRRVFLDEGEAIAALLPRLRQVAPTFVASLLEAFSASPTKPLTTAHALSASAKTLIEPLSKTQLSILRLVAEGLSNREIAARLTITEGTTKWHMNQIFGKLNVASRTQAVAQARHLKLI